MESRERPLADCVRGLGEHHRQFGHALAMLSGIGRLVVDCRVDEPDEGFEEDFELVQQLPVGQRDGGLRGERLGEALVRFGKRHDDIVLRHAGIDQLQHADDLALVVLHRHREE
mgnify:CR=1 FL=1